MGIKNIQERYSAGDAYPCDQSDNPIQITSPWNIIISIPNLLKWLNGWKCVSDTVSR